MKVLLIILTLSFFSFFFNKKKFKLYCLLASLSLGLLAYNYKPTIAGDLYRHYIMLEEFKMYGFNYILKTHYFRDTPTFAVYAYLISLLSKKEFLPMITTFIVYFLPFQVINKICLKYKIRKNYRFISLFFLMSTLSYLSVIGGIRNMLAFSIFSFYMYEELYEKRNKKICYLGYLISLFIHSSVIILLVIKMIPILKKKWIIFISLIFMSWPLHLKLIMKLLEKFNGIPIFLMISKQINGYFLKEGGGTQYVYSVAFIRSLTLIIIIILLLSVFFKKRIQIEKYINFYSILVCFTLAAVFQYDLYVRMVSFLSISSPVIILESLRGKQNKKTIYIYMMILAVATISLWFNTWSEYVKIEI